jgi:hypothetical protein
LSMVKLVIFFAVGLLWLGPLRAGALGAIAPAEAEDRRGGDAPDRGYGELEKQLRQLLQDLEKLGTEAGEKIQKELIPLLKKEIERLKKRLREFQFRQKEKSEPVWTWEDGCRRAALPVRTVGAA